MTSSDSQSGCSGCVATALDAELPQQWSDALVAEDSKKVKELLPKDKKLLGELLHKGWKRESDAVWRGRTALHVAVRRGNVELVDELLKALSEECRLLEVVDVDYELDALAMAVISGNREIANLLKNASLTQVKRNPFEIWKITPTSQDGHEEGSHDGHEDGREEAAANLKAITKRVLNNDTQIMNLYDRDCDFNFLDKELYFFHFTFSTWESDDLMNIMKEIRENIFSEASREGQVLDYLLLHLRDGQGRTALHVAVDSQRVLNYLELLKPEYLEESDQESLKVKEYLNVRDSAGRTPLYRAAAKQHLEAVEDLLTRSNGMVDDFARVECKADQWGRNFDIDKLSQRNGFKSDCVYITQRKLKKKAFNNETNAQDGPGPNMIEPLEMIYSTALHAAIIHRHKDVVEKLLDQRRLSRSIPRNTREKVDKVRKFRWSWIPTPKEVASGPSKAVPHPAYISDIDCCRRLTWPTDASLGGGVGHTERFASAMHLAVLVGSVPILQKLLVHEEHKEKGYISPSLEKHFPSFLLAAAKGSPGTIKAFLDSKERKFDPHTADTNQNTALHYALQGRFVRLHPHLVDFVGCDHVYKSRWENTDWISGWLADPEEMDTVKIKTQSVEAKTNLEYQDRKEENKRRRGQRVGSISLLLQAGVDVWKMNTDKKAPTPEADAPDDFVEWWYDKVQEQTKHIQEQLNDAANSISVTAALVATASFLGPLTPPLGYNDDPTSAKVGIFAVRIFVVCDSLSFYFALAAIMLALVPSLPMPYESIFNELVFTRIMVAVAVTLLFPSIFLLLVAFASAFIAVVPDHGLSHNGLTVATTVVGGFICLVVKYRIFIRLMKVLWKFPPDCWQAIEEFFAVKTIRSVCRRARGVIKNVTQRLKV